MNTIMFYFNNVITYLNIIQNELKFTKRYCD